MHADIFVSNDSFDVVMGFVGSAAWVSVKDSLNAFPKKTIRHSPKYDKNA